MQVSQGIREPVAVQLGERGGAGVHVIGDRLPDLGGLADEMASKINRVRLD